jgi:hypothetical protein
MSSAGHPTDPLPPLDSLQRALLPVADGFMVVMLSRPPSGTLRTTRVTWATIALSVVTAAVSVVLAVVLLRSSIFAVALRVVLVAALAGMAVGSASVAVYGLRQRR